MYAGRSRTLCTHVPFLTCLPRAAELNLRQHGLGSRPFHDCFVIKQTPIKEYDENSRDTKHGFLFDEAVRNSVIRIHVLQMNLEDRWMDK